MSEFDKDWLLYCYDRITDLFLECLNVEDSELYEVVSDSLRDCFECIYFLLGQARVNEYYKQKVGEENNV